MKKLITLFLAVLICSCATSKFQSVEEAQANFDAAVRTGAITKDDRLTLVSQLRSVKLPDKSPKPLNLAEIERRAVKGAAKMGNFARINQQYNSGAINFSQWQSLIVQEQEYRLQNAAILAGIAAMQSTPTAGGYGAQATPAGGFSGTRYDPNSLANPYGAGNPYKANGLMNPYSQYGSRYSNKSWTNPYATDAPKIYGPSGQYHGKLSTNKYDPESISNPYGRYGSKYSPESLNNPYGAGNPYSGTTYYVVPQP